MAPDPEVTPPKAGRRFRADRLVPFSVLVLLLSFAGGYLLVRRASHFSWTYITNSVLLTVLFFTNGVLVLTLITLLMRNLIKALVERRRGILGSRFRTKLVFSSLLLWLVPSGIIFWAALNLIQRSVDRWFNAPMDQLTEGSQMIVDTYYDEARQRAAAFAAEVAGKLADDELLRPAARSDLHRAMGALLRTYRLDLVAVDFGRGAPYLVLDPHLPATSGLRDLPPDRVEAAFRGEPFTWQSEFHGGHLIRSGQPVRAAPGEKVVAVVTAGIFVPRDLARMAESITRSNEDYRQIRTQKGLIKRVYVLVFGLITLVVLFSVTWIGLYLTRRITEPIQSLAQGTREISSGNLDFRVTVEAGDELGILVESFNSMTADLKSGKEMIERRNQELSRSNRELMERRRYIETLLQNIATGVVSFDREGKVTTINRAALALLALPPGIDPVGLALPPLLPPGQRELMESLVGEVNSGGNPGAARDVELPVRGRSLTMAVSATILKGDAGEMLGTIVVLEDLTDLMRAQKIAAWREVARRLAHEIKNPLTPIQLSAERIRKKFVERSDDLEESVEEGTATIVREVAALKNLLDEFARFARLPAPNPVPTDLKVVVDAALALYDGVHSSVRIEPRLEPGLPPVMLDPEQMKRVLINLLDNAAEAMGGHGTVTVAARRDRAAGTVRLEVSDDGPGIRPEVRDRLFLPYFSTKKRGTGLGLAIVHRIVTDHMGRIRVEDNEPHGARFVIDLPANAA